MFANTQEPQISYDFMVYSHSAFESTHAFTRNQRILHSSAGKEHHKQKTEGQTVLP